MSRIRKAVVLAAGRGTRLGDLTRTIPKPMLDIAGKPFLERKLLALEQSGIREVCIVIGYLGDTIRAHFSSGMGGLEITYCEQAETNGTGGALLLASEFASEPFLACFGDILLHPATHYSAVCELFASEDADAVLAANWVPDPAVGGAVYFDERFRITRMVEKPAPGTSTTHYNQAGCFAFRPEIFEVLAGLTPSPRGEIELTAAVSALLSRGSDVLAYPLPEQDWLDIGTPELLERTRKVFTN